MASSFLLLGLLATASSVALAYDPSPLQDFCVADLSSPVMMNGHACKDPMQVTDNDFVFRGLSRAGNTSNPFGSFVTNVNVTKFPALNTLGISLARIDYAPGGVNTPHIHPRATEILTCLQGSLQVGFVTSNPDNHFFTTVLQAGDTFVFPKSMIHFQRNVGNRNAIALSMLSSQNPGVITIARAIFGSKPRIPTDILAKSFQVDESIIRKLLGHPSTSKLETTN